MLPGNNQPILFIMKCHIYLCIVFFCWRINALSNRTFSVASLFSHLRLPHLPLLLFLLSWSSLEILFIPITHLNILISSFYQVLFNIPQYPDLNLLHQNRTDYDLIARFFKRIFNSSAHSRQKTPGTFDHVILVHKFKGARCWNLLPDDVKSVNTCRIFVDNSIDNCSSLCTSLLASFRTNWSKGETVIDFIDRRVKQLTLHHNDCLHFLNDRTTS